MSYWFDEKIHINTRKIDQYVFPKSVSCSSFSTHDMIFLALLHQSICTWVHTCPHLIGNSHVESLHMITCICKSVYYLLTYIQIWRYPSEEVYAVSAVEKASSIDLCHDLVCLLEQIVSQLQKHGWTEDSDRAFTTEMTSLLKQQIAGAILKSLAQSVLLSHHISYLWRGLDILLLYYCCTCVLLLSAYHTCIVEHIPPWSRSVERQWQE